MCKTDDIRVDVSLQMAIEEVKTLYSNLPKLEKTSAE